jgi:hypothetical protein
VEELDGDQRVVARHPERVLEADAQHRSLVLIPLGQGTASIALSLASPAAGQQVSVGGVRVDYFACGEDIGGRPPLGTIGLCYHDPREIETLLRDLIEHYEHYRATARAFAPSWMEYHNADRLVRELRAVAGHAVPELAGVAEDTALAAHAQG